MGLLNKKMLLAPVLAVTLALLLAGAVSFLPQTVLQNPPAPNHTSSSNAPATPLPTTAAALSNDATAGGIDVLFFGVAALLIGIVAAFLFFSEKKLNKEISG
jgi:hypothetical protein